MCENKIIYSCEEHIEIALDDYITRHNDEKAPNLELCSDETCNYCNKNAKYKIH